MRRLAGWYRWWWLLLDSGRLVVRAVVEARRNSLIWPAGMALRWAAHLLAASPWFGLWFLTLTLTGPHRPVLIYGLALCISAELAVVVARLSGHRVVEGFWLLRRSVALRRRWPRSWGDYAGRTRMVQAATGKEPSTPIRWRPLVDHPRLSWLAVPAGDDTVEFLVGPPPDRTYNDLVTAGPALAAKFSFVESIEVDYDSDRSSLAVLTVTFTRTGRRHRPAPALRLVPNDDQDQGDQEVAS